MAMNKAEKALVEELRVQVALRWTAPVIPDVPPPSGDAVQRLSKGFLFCGETSSMGGAVDKACSSSVHHSIGRDDQTTSQHSRHLYSTRLLALRALRYATEKYCAGLLRRIDAQIEIQVEGEERARGPQ